MGSPVDVMIDDTLLSNDAPGDEVPHAFRRQAMRLVEGPDPPPAAGFVDRSLEAHAIAVVEHRRA